MKQIVGNNTYRFTRWLLPVGTTALFVWLAGRIAATRQFPLPYDEGFHFGLIKVYTQHLNPFLSAQPAGADSLGAVARDPSYLYHYLMSFPLRLLEQLTPNVQLQIWGLRSLNIGLALVTLYLVYRLAKKCGLPTLGAQLVSLCLAITPVFYNLSAQINYDNLLLPLTLVSLLATINCAARLRDHQLPVRPLSLLVGVLLLTSLVKYSFLPLAGGFGVYLVIVAVRKFGIRGLLTATLHAVRAVPGVHKLALVTLLLASSILWGQRYVVNMATYHTPHPQCHVVLSVSQCSQYGPWARNYQLHQTRDERAMAGNQLLPFIQYWSRSVYLQTYSLVHSEGTVVVYVQNNAARLVAKAAVVGALVSALLAYRLIRRQGTTWTLFAVVSACYLLTLFGQNYSDFQNLHALVAIQGRYLLPVLPLLYIATALAYNALLTTIVSLQTAKIQAILTSLVVIGWLGLRQLRRMGTLAVQQLVSRHVGIPVISYDSPEVRLTIT